MPAKKLIKELVVITIIASFCSCACKKETKPTPDPNLVGNWHWVSQDRGSLVNRLTPQNTGINETLQIKRDGSWQLIQNTVMIHSGTYATRLETTSVGKQVSAIHYYIPNVVTDSTAFYQVNKDSLVFGNYLGGAVTTDARMYVKTL
jgi:hypothetical protein